MLDGALEHKDSMGDGSVVRPGELQRMSAGTGVTHSEYNHSRSEPVHLLQIWIVPERKGLTPGYEQRSFPTEEKRGQLRIIAARDGRKGAVTLHQDADLFVALLDREERVVHRLKSGRHAWVQVVRGAVVINGMSLKAGDGAAVSDEDTLEISANEASEILLFDLA